VLGLSESRGAVDGHEAARPPADAADKLLSAGISWKTTAEAVVHGTRGIKRLFLNSPWNTVSSTDG